MTDERKEKLKKLAKLFITVVLPLILGGVGVREIAPKEKEVPVEKLIEVLVPVLDEFTPPGTGWVRDDEAIATNTDPAKTLQFAQTDAGRAVLGDADVLLYRAVRKAGKFPANAYPNINQGNVGCCVGAGYKHGCDVVQATAIAGGQNFEWKPVSAEAIYAYSRVEVGKGRIGGDGSLGAWAKEAVSRGGMLAMAKYDGHDLTRFDPARARAWGRTGVPDELEPIARRHPVKGTALVTSAVDVKRAIGQGYPVVVCSDVGFNNPNGTVGTRDADGFIRPRGTWPHCMLFCGWRSGARPGALCLNSWGDTAHGGPVWPEDAPRAAFWVDEAVVDRMVRQGDSFALSDVVGFPAREKLPLDWFVRAQEPRPRMPIELFPVALAW